jgi:5-methyltetrahydropteroyltriglutamate--homocysteine methyltransferase
VSGAANSPACDPGPKRRDPFGKLLMPGVISHVTNVVEHPELVSERIVRLSSTGRPRKHYRRYQLWFCARAVLPVRASEHQVGQIRRLVEGARLAGRELGA